MALKLFSAELGQSWHARQFCSVCGHAKVRPWDHAASQSSVALDYLFNRVFSRSIWPIRSQWKIGIRGQYPVRSDDAVSGETPEDDVPARLVRAAEGLAMMIRQVKEDNPHRADEVDFIIRKFLQDCQRAINGLGYESR